MAQSTLAGVITAIATVITALALLITAVGVLVPQLRKTHKAVAKTIDKVEQVHTIVNQQRTDQRRYQERLIEALAAAGVAIPQDTSLRPADEDLAAEGQPRQRPADSPDHTRKPTAT